MILDVMALLPFQYECILLLHLTSVPGNLHVMGMPMIQVGLHSYTCLGALWKCFLDRSTMNSIDGVVGVTRSWELFTCLCIRKETANDQIILEGRQLKKDLLSLDPVGR